MSHEDTIRMLYNYISDLGLTKNKITGLYFDRVWRKQKSYAKWTCYELIMLLKNNKDKPALLIVEDFIHDMDSYALVDTRRSFIFSVAKDTAENILDLLL